MGSYLNAHRKPRVWRKADLEPHGGSYGSSDAAGDNCKKYDGCDDAMIRVCNYTGNLKSQQPFFVNGCSF